MVIVSLMGGLGNQLFQYSLAKHLEMNLLVPDVFLSPEILCVYGNRSLGLQEMGLDVRLADRTMVRECLGPIVSNPRIRWLLGSRYGRGLRPKCFITDDRGLPSDLRRGAEVSALYFHGYWQNSTIVGSVWGALWRGFSFPPFDTKCGRMWAERISRSNAVAVHVRRGDYLSAKARRHHGVLSDSYYQAAAQLLIDLLVNPTFFVFSDDPDYVSRSLSNLIQGRVEVVVTSDDRPSVDLQLMSLCRHNVIANSTYSWWAATLNIHPEKVVIAPDPWFADGSRQCDLLPSSWIRVPR